MRRWCAAAFRFFASFSTQLRFPPRHGCARVTLFSSYTRHTAAATFTPRWCHTPLAFRLMPPRRYLPPPYVIIFFWWYADDDNTPARAGVSDAAMIRCFSPLFSRHYHYLLIRCRMVPPSRCFPPRQIKRWCFFMTYAAFVTRCALCACWYIIFRCHTYHYYILCCFWCRARYARHTSIIAAITPTLRNTAAEIFSHMLLTWWGSTNMAIFLLFRYAFLRFVAAGQRHWCHVHGSR